MRCPTIGFAPLARLRGLAWPALLAAACSLSGCGSNHDDLTKRLASMQSDLTKLQSHSDRLEERLEALEMRKEAPATKTANESATTLDRPRLMIVKLEPGDDTHEAPADAPTAELRPEDSAADKSPRPVIRVYGNHSDGDVDSSDSPRHKR
jgi:outer membrane murein-binding lipoprotein Lpp